MLTLEEEIACQGIISPERREQNIQTLKDLNLDLPFDLETVDSKCHECVLKQLDKYNKFVDEFGKSYKGKFTVPCEGVNVDYFDKNMRSGFTDEQWDEIKAQIDIVHWAKKYLKQSTKDPWEARWYQEHILRCTSRRKILRISRRCLTGDTPVLMADGSWKRIDMVSKGDIVVSRHSTKNLHISRKVSNFFDNGVQPIFNITLNNGLSIKATSNHPFLARVTSPGKTGCSKEWRTIESGLSVGSYIYISNKYEKFGSKSAIEEAKLLGYLLSDGYIAGNGQTPKVTSNTKVYIDEIKNISSSLFGYSCTVRQREDSNAFDVYITDGDKRTSNKCIEWLDTLGLVGQKAQTKTFDSFIDVLDKESTCSFLNRLFSGDGCCSTWYDNSKSVESGEISLTSCNFGLLDSVRLVFLKLGISSYISLESKRKKVPIIRGREISQLNDYWKLRISDSNSIIQFIETIGPIFGKEEASIRLFNIAKSKKKRRKKGNKYFRGMTIKSIVPIGEEKTYCIEVEKDHNFIANGILVSNSGKTDMVCIDICYHLFTTPNIRIVVAGPQKAQTEEIINRVRDFIRNAPELASCVVRDVSAPYYNMKLTNGAELRGFAAGGTKGGDGSSIRGQDADRLYLEEMDFIAEEAISSAVLPLLQTKAGTSLVGFSTPSGMRTPYYSFCMETPEAKEFHYSYHVLPHAKEVEKDRGRYTEERWTHEFLAEFGSSDAGVYKPHYVDGAMEHYRYTDFKPTQGWKYCIGTDWNEKYGTEIYVLGFNPFKGRFYGVEALHIEPSQFTQLEGVNKLLEMNRKWRPEFIYIDAGNGSTNEELLMSRAMKARRYGGDPATADLVKTLKKYDLGSAIHTKDQVTKQPVKKPAKAFMVNASVRLFEQDRIRIASEDTKLDKQLRNYIIERYTPNGNPVYGQNDEKIGDHRLDALNLAIVAFHLEFDELHATNMVNTEVAAVPDPRVIKMMIQREQKGEEIHHPHERRLEGDGGQNELEMLFFPSAPGRLSFSSNLKTNRLGWDTDQEAQRLLEAKQRRKGRISLRRERPTREKF